MAEAAAELGITRQALNVRIQRGQQVTVRAGADTPTPGAWLIRAEDVDSAGRRNPNRHSSYEHVTHRHAAPIPSGVLLR
ncbi:hypothetical protein MMAGJ_12480 [Mycolicibacterium mageritense]|uniref:DNA-binding protein n=1 Tax=Mycolicibacterium mageritense TaxID=53462 RepID=A0ABN5Y3K5_MYCME|nr:hypothetical protein MMAGJ_12480 [Mycolicibacterium mageritense]